MRPIETRSTNPDSTPRRPSRRRVLRYLGTGIGTLGGIVAAGAALDAIYVSWVDNETRNEAKRLYPQPDRELVQKAYEDTKKFEATMRDLVKEGKANEIPQLPDISVAQQAYKTIDQSEASSREAQRVREERGVITRGAIDLQAIIGGFLTFTLGEIIREMNDEKIPSR